ncbi:hypothetical protein HZH68_004350 [Vespula germanica]|uniref:Uncharacterized protein n=1 Tax=Vespula germanica TaxID=30212 RepID=A0A834NJB7_VESGE|nr:hypothetical protein HZH68_004350 [Vespula germanica]
MLMSYTSQAHSRTLAKSYISSRALSRIHGRSSIGSENHDDENERATLETLEEFDWNSVMSEGERRCQHGLRELVWSIAIIVEFSIVLVAVLLLPVTTAAVAAAAEERSSGRMPNECSGWSTREFDTFPSHEKRAARWCLTVGIFSSFSTAVQTEYQHPHLEGRIENVARFRERGSKDDQRWWYW